MLGAMKNAQGTSWRACNFSINPTSFDHYIVLLPSVDFTSQALVDTQLTLGLANNKYLNY